MKKNYLRKLRLKGSKQVATPDFAKEARIFPGKLWHATVNIQNSLIIKLLILKTQPYKYDRGSGRGLQYLCSPSCHFTIRKSSGSGHCANGMHAAQAPYARCPDAGGHSPSHVGTGKRLYISKPYMTGTRRPSNQRRVCRANSRYPVPEGDKYQHHSCPVANISGGGCRV